MAELIVGADGRSRPVWAAHDELLRSYYDTEWGMPVRDERGLFERLSLEAFQSGLSWATILRKREAFRAAFEDFQPDRVAGYGPDRVEELLADAGIVRNRRKIEATINNAALTVALRDDPDLRGAELASGLPTLIWSHLPAETPKPTRLAEVPTRSAEGDALAADLKRRGFRHVGLTTMFALMEAIGMVDTHLVGSWRRGSSGI